MGNCSKGYNRNYARVDWMKKVGITTSFLGNLRAGTWQYTRHLLEGAASVGEVFRIDREQRSISGIELPLRSYSGGGEKLAKLLWPNFTLPGGAGADGFDLVHCTTPYGTFMPCRYRNLITVCDVTPLLFPGTHGRLNVWHHRYALPAILKRADRIITISECSKRDIVRIYNIPEEKISVTLLAADSCYRPVPEGRPSARVAAVPVPYILNVGTLEPRKNLTGLIRSYAAARRNGVEHKLVIAGAKGWGESSIAGLIKELGVHDSVLFCGFIEDADLPHLYAGADFFVYPSLYEGFGLPVLEAMACGTPVITSGVSSIPEVAGDAGILVDPRSELELASAITRMAGDRELRENMRGRGLQQAAKFNWESTVKETLQIYDEVLA